MIGIILSISLISVWMDRWERKLYGVKPGVSITGYDVGGFLPEEVGPVVDELVIRWRRVPWNATLDWSTGRIIAEQWGWEVNRRETTRQIFAAPPGQKLLPTGKKIAPRYYVRDLESLNRQMGCFSTGFYGSWQRHQNISLALMSINNTVIWPGTEFSFNRRAGPRTPERGYRLAPIIGEEGLGYGGGVCQVSTTLFNAAHAAGLKVLERHLHSKRVPYVEPGRDATVVYGAQDLRLFNAFEHPVIIKAGIYRGKITVLIMGR